MLLEQSLAEDAGGHLCLGLCFVFLIPGMTGGYCRGSHMLLTMAKRRNNSYYLKIACFRCTLQGTLGETGNE